MYQSIIIAKLDDVLLLAEDSCQRPCCFCVLLKKLRRPLEAFRLPSYVKFHKKPTSYVYLFRKKAETKLELHSGSKIGEKSLKRPIPKFLTLLLH